MHKTEGTYHDSNTFTDGPPGTRVEKNWLNAVQKELVTVIEDAGLTLKTASTETGTQLLAALDTMYIEKGGVDTLGRNILINGGFPHAQRGASGAASFTGATVPLNSDDTYLLDRWLLLSDGNDIVDVTQQSGGGVSGNEMYARLDVETVQKKFGLLQVIEGKNCKSIIGDTASLSFEAKVTNTSKLSDIRVVVVAWDGAVDTVTSDIISAWNAEGVRPTLVANWTAENIDTNLGVTTSWVKYEIPNISIDTASTTNVGIFIYQNNVATNDTDGIFLELTNVQLEAGNNVTNFEYRDVGHELRLCQRYYSKSYDQDIAPGTADNDGAVYAFLTGVANADHTVQVSETFPVDMRTVPTVTLYDNAGGSAQVSMTAGAVAGVISNQGTRGFQGSGTNGAVATQRWISFHYTAKAEL